MKIQYSALVGSTSGKLNGSVASRNKGGAILRTKAIPINPSTTYQSTQRSYMQQVANAWPNLLTDQQRAGWVAFGQSANAINVFGNGLILSGIAAFQAVNRIILASGGTLVPDAPTDNTISSVQSLSLTANHVGPVLSVTFTPTPLTSPEGLYIFATPAISPGISNASSSLRLINFYPSATSPLDISSEWIARFGAFPPTAGKRIAITAQAVNQMTGSISAANGTSTLII